MPANTTVAVWGIAPTAAVDDVSSYFEARIPGCQPVVGPLVREEQSARQVTTVTFRGRSKRACKKAVQKLKEEDELLRSSHGFSTNVGFSQSFTDLTLLESRSPQPVFDVYFVHGLEGSAWKTFASKSRNHKRIRMWARDFLPDTLYDPPSQVEHGRYLTFGYPSPIFDRNSEAQSIKRTAQDLLTAISVERGNNCRRPLFFVCHSLGGLVVEQALLLLLREQKEDTDPRILQDIFCPSGECLVKGITFFGTPFGGSKLANILASISNFLRLPLNRSHIMSLRIDDQDLPAIFNEFRDRITTARIPLLCFYERLPERLGIFKHHVVMSDSAAGKFGEQFRSIGLLTSHTGLVKFGSPEDRIYKRNVSPHIKSQIFDALAREKRKRRYLLELALPKFLGPEADSIYTIQPLQEKLPQVGKQVDLAKRGLMYTQQDLALELRTPTYTEVEREWMSDLVMELQNKFDTRHHRRKNRISLCREACLWILENEKYKEFIAAESDAVLFIEAGPGYGKSSLAKFLTQELAQNPNAISNSTPTTTVVKSGTASHPLIVEYFTKKEGHDNSPTAILTQILFQISRKAWDAFEPAALSLFSTFFQQRDLEFYWSLFNRIRQYLDRDLFCIIDGLDECIRQQRSDNQVLLDHQMIGFLRELCEMDEQKSSSGDTQRTKILITTRYENEVQEAVPGRNLLKISPAHIADSFKLVIEQELCEIFANRLVSTEARAFIVTEVVRRCSPVFQAGITAVRLLGESADTFDLDKQSAVVHALQDFDFADYNDVYAEVLQRIHPQDQETAAKILRILYFSKEYLDLDDLQHALAVDKNKATIDDLSSPPSKSSISNLINRSLGTLVDLKSDGTLDLQHQSIYDFLRTLSIPHLGFYSCQDIKEGNLHLALICIQYLNLWAHQQPSEQEIDSAEGDQLLAALKKSPFCKYACRYWTFHTREAADFIEPHIAIVNSLLCIPGSQLSEIDGMGDYQHMHVATHLQDNSVWSPDEIPDQLSFLCAQNMDYLLSLYLKPRPKHHHHIFAKLFSKSSSQAKAPFILDHQDRDGSTALHVACEKGFVNVTRLLLDAGAIGSMRNNSGYTPFAYALEGGCGNIASLLVQHNQAFDGGNTQEGISCIHYAALNGMESMIKFLLNPGANPNSKSSVGWTPVHLAVQEGHIEILKLLLKSGGSPDSVTSRGVTPLHLAAQEGYLEIVKLLFKLFPNLNPSPQTTRAGVPGTGISGTTPLNLAASNGHLLVFNFMKELENPPIPNSEGSLPVHLAALSGHLSIVKQYEDLDDLTKPNNSGKTPLHFAAINGHLGVFKYLRAQVPEDSADKTGLFPIHLAAINGNTSIVKLYDGTRSINSKTPSGYLPIHLAISGGNFETFKWLKEHGSDNDEDEDGELPLHLAARNGHHAMILEFPNSPDTRRSNHMGMLPIHLAAALGHTKTAKALLEIGSPLDPRADSGSDDNSYIKTFPYSPLQLAIAAGCEEVALFLLDQGVSFDIPGPLDQGLLHFAAATGSTSVFKWILEHGQDPWQRDQEGNTPLHSAVSESKAEIVQIYINLSRNTPHDLETQNLTGVTPFMMALAQVAEESADALLAAGADVQHRSLTGMTSLMFASTMKSHLVSNLLDHHVSVDATDVFMGGTALHYASSRKIPDNCQLLIDHGANVNVQTSDGWTPLMEATRGYSRECVEILLAAGADVSLYDSMGRTVFDYAKGHSPISQLLEPHRQSCHFLSKVEQDQKVRASLHHFLFELPNDRPARGSVDAVHFDLLLWYLAHFFFHLEEYDNTRICLESRVYGCQWSERDFDLTCDLCDKMDAIPSYWICKNCPTIFRLCPSCYEERSEEKGLPACDMTHEYFQVGGQKWARRDPQFVDDDGKTLTHFIVELKQKWCVEGEESSKLVPGSVDEPRSLVE